MLNFVGFVKPCFEGTVKQAIFKTPGLAKLALSLNM